MLHKMFRLSAFMNLIRVLFPSWSFFDQVETRVLIEAKPAGSSAWTELTAQSEHSLGALFHNPSVNLNHAIENVLREFLRDMKPYLEGSKEIDEIELAHMISFRQLCAWSRFKLEARGFSRDSETGRFQFRLKSQTGEVFFVSHELALASL